MLYKLENFFLRQIIKAEWNALSNLQIQTLGECAVEKIEKNSFWQQALNVFIYAPIKYEISFLFLLMQKFPTKNFAFPFIQNENLKFYFAKQSDLYMGKYGILEPSSQKPALNPDLIFVPALATDSDGNRLGRGKGFYDRFLKNCFIPKICVLPKFALLSKIPTQPHDQKINQTITIN